MTDIKDIQHPCYQGDIIKDPWIANSLMQKAIRRGESEIAINAALSFYAMRGSAVWRRLMIIACEDVGIGSIETVIGTVRACTDVGLRRSTGGNAEVIRRLAETLARAAKDRSADHLIAAAALHPDLEAARRKMASIESAERLEVLRDGELPLGVRATAAWFASGLEWDRERRILGGNLDALVECYGAMGAPPDLVETALCAARRIREPLAALLPLLSLSKPPGEGRIVEACASHISTYSLDGIPLYAFDMHTRIGRQALTQLTRGDPVLQAIIEQYAPARSGVDAVRLAAFHVEGACTRPRFTWALSQSIEQLGVEADLLSAGVKLEGHEALLEAVRERLPALNDLRLHFYSAARQGTPAS